ncbi:MAG: hypothetical protein IJX12_07880 [Lachnospiraceae bacterium]|nr:hypothetical protein [Lachnospiraceae bacterium]
MVEYLYDAIRASVGEDIAITAKISDNGSPIVVDCYLELNDDDSAIIRVIGHYADSIWEFLIPGSATKGLEKGRYWYSIHYNDTSLAFDKPIYLI